MNLYSNLSDNQKSFFYGYYRILGHAAFTERYNQEFSEQRPAHWAPVVAKRLGISQHPPDGYFSVQEAAFLLKLSESTIREAIRKKRIKGVKSGKYWFISMDSFEIMKMRWQYKTNSAPWPAISTKEAANRIGVTTSCVSVYAKKGFIDSFFDGKNWFVRKSDIDEIVNHMRKTGATKVDWVGFARKKQAQHKAA